MTQSDLAISVRGLGKCYRRITKKREDSVRDLLQESVGALLRRAKGGKTTTESFWALSDASFDIKRGENVGIIGLNGAGKSTLLKVLSRIVTPTTGEAKINGRLGALLEVGTGFHQELSGRENIFLYGAILGMSRAEVASKFDAIVAFSEIGDFIDTPVKRYSSGMYVRLAFSVAAHLDPDILLLDEVLAVGDAAFQKKCMDFARSLERKGSTILFVSHNMFSIKTMCPRVIYLKKGKIVFDGPTDEGLKLYEDDSRLATSPWFNSESKDAPPITITDISLLGDSGEEKTVFDHGERMTVRLRYQTSRPVVRPDIRIGINRSDDTHCCAFTTHLDNADMPVIDGEGEIVLRTPPLLLVADLYTTTIAVREREVQIAAQLGTNFHVRHPILQTLGYGVYHQPGEWTLKPAVPAVAIKQNEFAE
jgi:lipopolysaccharide transport system ATP-binding protein